MQDVIYGFHHARFDIYSKRRKSDRHRIPKACTVQQRQTFISRILFQLNPAQCDRYVRNSYVVITDILLRPLLQLLNSRLRLKVKRKIYGLDICKIVGARAIHHRRLY